MPFLTEGSPTKIDYRKKKRYPYSNLSTGGSSCVLDLLSGIFSLSTFYADANHVFGNVAVVVAGGGGCWGILADPRIISHRKVY